MKRYMLSAFWEACCCFLALPFHLLSTLQLSKQPEALEGLF